MVSTVSSRLVLATKLELLSVKNPGSFGFGRKAPSVPNIETTDGIVGLSDANFCTHNNPTCMHLFTWGSMNVLLLSFKHSSISSRIWSPLQSSHAFRKVYIREFFEYNISNGKAFENLHAREGYGEDRSCRSLGSSFHLQSLRLSLPRQRYQISQNTSHQQHIPEPYNHCIYINMELLLIRLCEISHFSKRKGLLCPDNSCCCSNRFSLPEDPCQAEVGDFWIQICIQ